MNYSKLYEILSKRQHAFLQITKTDSFGLEILSKTRRYNHYSMYDHDEVIISVGMDKIDLRTQEILLVFFQIM